MVLAGRPARGDDGRQRWWLVLGLVITSIVLIIDASIKSANPAPARQLAAQAWLDRALALVAQSNVQAAELAGFRTTTAAGLTATVVTDDLTAVTDGARSTYQQLEALRPPALLQASAGLLQTCLLLRSEASAAIASAVGTALGGTVLSAGATTAAAPTSSAASSPTSSAAAGTTKSAAAGPTSGATQASATTPAGAARAAAAAADQLQLADEAYRLFAANLPASVGVAVPASAWVTQAGLYTQASLEVFLSALRGRVTLAPVYRLGIVSLRTVPAPLGTTGASGAGGPVETLLPSSGLAVTVVVTNLGNTDQPDLTVVASLSAATGPSSVRRPLHLGVGATVAVTLSGLAPRLGRTVTLTVSVAAPAGSPTAPVRTSIRFVMPAPTSAKG